MNARPAPVPLVLTPGARALFTDRSHGNLSSVGGDGAEYGERERARLRELVGVRQLARAHQVHGAEVRRLRDAPRDEPQAPFERADGVALAAAGVAAMVLSADCVPVVLGGDGCVAALHAGWRGLAAGVLEEGVRALRELQLRSGPIAALIGPCAGVCCYEVGEEVHDAFGHAHRDGRRIDLRAIARERLAAAGVERVGDELACTVCDERFFSHRREGERAGRQAGLAWLS